MGAVDGGARSGGWGLWVPGAGKNVCAMVVTLNQTRGSCVELAWALALAQGSKQATRDVQAELWAICRVGSCGCTLKLARLPHSPLLPLET